MLEIKVYESKTSAQTKENSEHCKESETSAQTKENSEQCKESESSDNSKKKRKPLSIVVMFIGIFFFVLSFYNNLSNKNEKQTAEAPLIVRVMTTFVIITISTGAIVIYNHKQKVTEGQHKSDKVKKRRKPWGIKRNLFVFMLIGILTFALLFYLWVGFVSKKDFPLTFSSFKSALEDISSNDKNEKQLTEVAQLALLTLGVLTGAGAAVISYRKQVVAEGQHDMAKSQHETDRLIKAVEMLREGNEANATVAAYTLERLARDSETFRAGIVEVLCGYFLEKNRFSEHGSEDIDTSKTADKNVDETSDSQNENKDNAEIIDHLYLESYLETVLFVLARLNNLYSYKKDLRFVLSGIDLRNYNLTLDNDVMSLQKVILADAHLEYADLSETNLKNAVLRGAHLANANLIKTNLEGARLREADLKNAHLEKANLYRAKLEKADLSGAHLDDKTDISKANLKGAIHTNNIWIAKWDDDTIFPIGEGGWGGIPKEYVNEASKSYKGR